VKTLAIDLSSAHGQVAVAADGRVTHERKFACDRGRGAGVFLALEDLREAWRDAGVIAVGIGPGSYNGLRAACALANSMQMATGARLCGAPSVCLLGVPERHYIVCGDARGGRAYRAEVRERKICGEIGLIGYDEAAARLKTEGVAVYRIGPLPCAEYLPEAAPEASVLALLAPELPATGPAGLQPIYLKPPHITLPRAGHGPDLQGCAPRC
jgi:tRNA threonylcarbamoyladenosine biosynthesis protein TsaB